MRSILLHDCTIANRQITHESTVAEVARARAARAQKSLAGKASAAAKKAAAAAEADQRDGNERSTGVATDVQPRAGKGEGPSQRTVIPFDTGQARA